MAILKQFILVYRLKENALVLNLDSFYYLSFILKCLLVLHLLLDQSMFKLPFMLLVL